MQSDFSIDVLQQKAQSVQEQRHRLLVIVMPHDEDDYERLHQLAIQAEWPQLNLSLELGRRLLGLNVQRRAIKARPFLEDVIDGLDREYVFLTDLEVLFEPSLDQDPLRLLQSLSRNRTIIAAWRGAIDNDHLVYAEPGHPEYQRYPTGELTYHEWKEDE